MIKCRRNISHDIAALNSVQKYQDTKINKKRNLSNLQLLCTFKLSQIVIIGVFLFVTLLNISKTYGRLTRKTYTVWDLSPKEFENLLEQEESLQKQKRNLDYFLRRRAKKTKEQPLEEYEGLPSYTQNKLGKSIL